MKALYDLVHKVRAVQSSQGCPCRGIRTGIWIHMISVFERNISAQCVQSNHRRAAPAIEYPREYEFI
jgi:hypothetical protein